MPRSTLDAGIQSGIEETRARNEAELLGMAMPTLTTEADVRQRQFQMSLRRDIERSLTNNPNFLGNLPVPAAEFRGAPTLVLTPTLKSASNGTNVGRQITDPPPDLQTLEEVVTTAGRPLNEFAENRLAEALVFLGDACKVVRSNESV